VQFKFSNRNFDLSYLGDSPAPFSTYDNTVDKYPRYLSLQGRKHNHYVDRRNVSSF
jgi:hypothetical protein